MRFLQVPCRARQGSHHLRQGWHRDLLLLAKVREERGNEEEPAEEEVGFRKGEPVAMPLDRKYDAAEVEPRLAEEWAANKDYAFDPKSAKPFYIIDTPPPFPTGEFHTGHVLNWCYMEFAARYKRMRGFEVLFPQGWDCHGFPTEVKVEQKWGKNLSREEFRGKCLEWTHEVVGSMKPQLIRMGYSVDWSREYYTIDPSYTKAVQYSLLKMFKEGLVYRGNHAVLWCPECASAIARAETEESPRNTKLNYLKFGGGLLIATTRPEYLHACVAVLYHPGDERYKQLSGKKTTVPLYGKEVPVLADNDVDKEFGTGLVMVCTFGDNQDVVWVHRHSLPIIDAFDERGRMANSGSYDGLYYLEARKRIISDLDLQGFLEKQEDLQQVVKIHDRCKCPVELMRSPQWFIKVTPFKEEMLETASKIRWVPEHMFNLFRDWTNGLEWDWCISRQRVFGTPMPFSYCDSCGEIVVPDESKLPVDPARDPAPGSCQKCGEKLIGEKSICDGWIDSSITPLIIAGWPEEFDEKLYPSSLRSQGTDIIRTWAFYTIFRCLKLTGKPCFDDIVVNGMVCGEDGKKMSKSLGNYVEAKDVVAKAGADSLRQWAALSGTTGKDNIFYWKDVNYAKSFATKMWNASRFVEHVCQGYEKMPKERRLRLTDKWILHECSRATEKVTKAMDDYDYYSAISTIYDFFWHYYCDYYLEDVKYRVYGDDADDKRVAQSVLREVLEACVKMLAPMAPFVTHEVYVNLFGGNVHKAEWPAASFEADETTLVIVKALHDALSRIRKHKAGKGLALNAELEYAAIAAPEAICKGLADVEQEIKAVGKVKTLEFKPRQGELELEF